jgi:hypothetical protein
MPIVSLPRDSSIVSTAGFIFIDTNQYLTLYNVVQGKTLLNALIEQQDHIFVTAQVVSEVERGKLKIAKEVF